MIFCVVRLRDFFVWRVYVSFHEERLHDVFGWRGCVIFLTHSRGCVTFFVKRLRDFF